jgi:hypothetical protein
MKNEEKGTTNKRWEVRGGRWETRDDKEGIKD